MYKTMAAFSGALIAIMVSFNSTMAIRTSSIFSIFVVHVVGLLTILALVLFKKEKPKEEGKVPVYLFFAGMIGVLLTYLNNLCVGAIGVSLALALGLVGQSALSCIIDHFGLFGVKRTIFSKKKIIGFAFVLVGAAVMAINQ